MLTPIAGLPDPPNELFSSLAIRTFQDTAFIRYSTYIARVNLVSGQVEWILKREPQDTTRWRVLNRRIRCSFDGNFRLAKSGEALVEIQATESGGVQATAWSAATGAVLWVRRFPVPEAAPWAEKTPAWSQAETEEIHAFLADDTEKVVLGFARHTRRSMGWSPTINVDWIPPFACQLDMTGLDPLTGTQVWQDSYPDVTVGIVHRGRFCGEWSHDGRMGVIDLESGSNRVLFQSPHSLGWPTRDSRDFVVSWHAKAEVGVTWISERGEIVRTGAWLVKKVRFTHLHQTGNGLALQTNDQNLHWLGCGSTPLWSIRAKPYIYSVHHASGANVYVATDGNGGRLLGFDVRTGAETLNLKQKLGGFGAIIEMGDGVFVHGWTDSPSYSVTSRLFVLAMKSGRFEICDTRLAPFAAWRNGVIGCIWKNAVRQGGEIAIADLRPVIEKLT